MWASFHFLPGNCPEGDHRSEFYNRMVCWPNSAAAKATVRACIVEQDRPFGLHRLGITAHVYADTWAHQGFAGFRHKINDVRSIGLDDPPGRPASFSYMWDILMGEGLGSFLALQFRRDLPPVGHGQAIHYPDHPFRRWHYRNGCGVIVTRDNTAEFLKAVEALYRMFRRYRLKNPDAAVDGLPATDRARIATNLKQFQGDDGLARNESWLESIRAGEFSFGSDNPQYKSSGPGSWKCEALGIDKAEVADDHIFDHPLPGFPTSNWKLFHDAANVHRVRMLKEYFGMCVP